MGIDDGSGDESLWLRRFAPADRAKDIPTLADHIATH